MREGGGCPLPREARKLLGGSYLVIFDAWSFLTPETGTMGYEMHMMQ